MAGEVVLYVEPYLPTPSVFIVGAGHVGKAVADLAGWMGRRPIVWDDRTELLDDVDAGARGPAGSIDGAITAASIKRRTSVVVVTRNVALDL